MENNTLEDNSKNPHISLSKTPQSSMMLVFCQGFFLTVGTLWISRITTLLFKKVFLQFAEYISDSKPNFC